MTYQETVDFLFEQLPQFQNIGGKAYNAKLDNSIQICELLDNPQNKIKTIHVAGTNGKGSVCNMLASILQESGYKVGLFTSPHLLDFRERVRINGEVISEKFVIDFVKNNATIFSGIKPSFFEWSTALAFDYFYTNKVDIAIIETGLGGRLDSTNIITPLVSVITTIGIDHTQYLGNTLEEIATEKGGVIKPNVPIVLGERIAQLAVFEKIAKHNHSKLYNTEQKIIQPETSLKGFFQKSNVATALEVCRVLQTEFPNLLDEKIEKGLLNIEQNTGLRGRWEILQESPKVICDIGHNVHAISESVVELDYENYKTLHIIWGMVADKEVEKVVDLLPINAKYYICSPTIQRAITTKKLEVYFTKKQQFESFSSCSEAFTQALKNAEKDDLIFIGGSTFVVSEILLEYFN